MRKGERGRYGAATGLIVAGGSRDLLGALQLCQRLSESKASWVNL